MGSATATGPPVEEVTVEKTVLRPGHIELTLRNDGPDPVEIAQVAVNDAYAPFSVDGGREIGRLGASTVDIEYPWIEAEAYEIFVLTSTGGTIEASIPVAAETPEADLGFFGLMALLGIYVGVIPISLGMLWLPFLRRVGKSWMAALIAFTVGLLAFLAVDTALEGLDIAGEAPAAFGGANLVFLGAIAAYLALAGVDSYLSRRGDRAEERRLAGRLPGAARRGRHRPPQPRRGAGDRLRLRERRAGARRLPGDRLRDPQHDRGAGDRRPAARRRRRRGARPRLGRLLALGLLAGGPAVLGAWIGAAAFNPSVAALLFGVGLGAIVRVIVQLAPLMRDERGQDPQPDLGRRHARRPRPALRDRAAGERLMGPQAVDRGLREGDLRALGRTQGAGHQRRDRRAARGHAGDRDLDAEAPRRPRARRLHPLQGRDADPGRAKRSRSR